MLHKAVGAVIGTFLRAQGKITGVSLILNRQYYRADNCVG